MLASITPLGERGRHSRWGVTAFAFVLGAIAGGITIGVAAGTVGAVASVAQFSAEARLAVFAFAALLAVALDVGPVRVPGPRRQVEERWRDEYRGWAYGLGYGTQLGAGVTTIVSSAATYVALLAAVLSAAPVSGALIFGLFGTVRGASILLVARVQRPEQLFAVHARLARWRSAASRVGPALLGAGVIVATVGVVA